MNMQTQTYDEQASALALEYTLIDFKRSLIITSVLANVAMFVTWLAISLS